MHLAISLTTRGNNLFTFIFFIIVNLNKRRIFPIQPLYLRLRCNVDNSTKFVVCLNLILLKDETCSADINK